MIKTQDKYRILSLKVDELMRYDTLAGGVIDYPLSRLFKPKSKAYYEKFGVILDRSLDSEELREAFPRLCRARFAFDDDMGTQYTLAVVSVDVVHTDGGSPATVQQKTQRLERLYEQGFCIDGKPYVRYKRSSGSSRIGKCLFIRKELLHHMRQWGECGLKRLEGDLSSWEAYKALSLSAIKGRVHIDPKGILVVRDVQSRFEDEVVAVRLEGEGMVAERTTASICNDIWDGESLLDESAFEGDWSDKHMLLLRNKYFKSCAFKTRLQRWLADNGIRSVEQLTALGHLTLAESIEDIVMVTTPNSLKFAKFCPGGATMDNLRSWAEHVSADFGVVKYDKRTRYFDGRMVQSSYQLLNTLPLSEEEAWELMRPQAELVTMVRQDPAVMRYYYARLTRPDKEVKEQDEQGPETNLYGRWQVLDQLMQINDRVAETVLYHNFVTDVVDAMRLKLNVGKLLLAGTNATLLGNAPELLLHTIGAFDGRAVMPSDHVRCTAFADGKRLLGARSPHITMGNLLLMTNDLGGDIWDYFDLGDNVVCINAIEHNVMHRLNGCDYDSDSMLVTDDPMLVGKATEIYGHFGVPVSQVSPDSLSDYSLAQLDMATSVNKIGDIVNLSQWLNSLLWDRYHRGETLEQLGDLYDDICILAVLSGIEIDRAKRHFPIKTDKVLNALREKYSSALYRKPQFAKLLIQKRDEKLARKQEKHSNQEGTPAPVIRYRYYQTAMDYLYKAVAKQCNYRVGKEGKKNYVGLSALFLPKQEPASRNDYNKRDAVVNLCLAYLKENARLRSLLRRADSDQAERLYADIQLCAAKYTQAVGNMLTNANVLRLALCDLEKKQVDDWPVYALLLQENNPYLLAILEESEENILQLHESPLGDIEIMGFRFVKY